MSLGFLEPLLCAQAVGIVSKPWSSRGVLLVDEIPILGASAISDGMRLLFSERHRCTVVAGSEIWAAEVKKTAILPSELQLSLLCII